MNKEIFRAFTAHPHAAGETYLEHLRFTFTMAARFALVAVIIIVHGIFPFLMPTTASRMIEKLYWVMKTRIPKGRREALDAAYLDYCV